MSSPQIHFGNPSTFNAAAANVVVGDLVVNPSSATTLVGIVRQGPVGRVVELFAGSVTVSVVDAAGGVLTRSLTVTVLDAAGEPVVGALITLGLTNSAANITSANVGATGKVVGRAIVAQGAMLMLETGAVGTVEVIVVAAGASDGEAYVSVMSPSPGRDSVAWTY